MGSFIPAVARVAVLAATAMLASPVWADDLQRQVQNMLDDFRAEYSFPGATAAYVLPDGTVATGLSDVEVIAPMTPQSRMLAASIGKSFAAATIPTLESQELLDREDLISKHLGDRPWFNRMPNKATTTASDLLRHTSGLPDHLHMNAFTGSMAERVRTGEDAITTEEVIGFVLDQIPSFDAGAGWAY